MFLELADAPWIEHELHSSTPAAHARPFADMHDTWVVVKIMVPF